MLEFFVSYKSSFVILHAFAAAAGVGAVFVTDVLFMKFLEDKRISQKEFEVLKTVSLFVWGTIIFLLATGIALYLSAPSDYLTKSKFITKILIFCVIICNGTLLHIYIMPALKKISFGEGIHTLSRRKYNMLKRLAFASGGISFVSWIIVFLLGSLRSIPITLPAALGIYAVIVFCTIIGSQLYLRILQQKS